MAKTDDPGFLELHIEKILLAAAVIMVPVLLTFMVAKGPLVEVVINGRTYSPDEVDKVLKEQAESLQKRINDADPKEKEIRNWAVDIENRYKDPTPLRTLTPLLAGGPRLESVEAPPEIRVALATLEKALPAPDQPVATAQPEVLMKPKPPAAGGVDDGGVSPARPVPAGGLLPTDFEYKEVIGTHVAAVFPRGKAMAAWGKALEKVRAPARVIVMEVEAQRQHRLPDGSWSPPEPVSATRVPEQAPFPPIPRPDGQNLPLVRDAVRQLQTAEAMQWICEPDYWTLFKDGQRANWMENKPRTKVSDLPGVIEPAPMPGTLYRTPRRSGTGERYPIDENIRRNPRTNNRVSPGRPPMDPIGPGGYIDTGPPPPNVRTRPRRIPNSGMGGMEPGMYGPVAPNVRRGRSAPRTTVPPRRTAPPGRTTIPPGRTTLPRGTLGEPAEPEPAELTPYVPTLATQLADPSGIFEVWFHDTTPELGREYRYRLRLVLVSPLLGRGGLVKDKADANKLSVATPWSAWSEPVGVQKTLDFFVTGSMPALTANRKDQVKVTVFKEVWGQLVSEGFNVQRGQRIRKQVTRKLMYYDGTEKEIDIDFDTGAWAVDFTFKVPVPRPGRISATDTELVYIDDRERLNRRSMEDDKDNARYQALKDRVESKALMARQRPWPAPGAP